MTEQTETIVWYRWSDQSVESSVAVPGYGADVITEPALIPGKCVGVQYRVTIQTYFVGQFPNLCVPSTSTFVRFVDGPVGPVVDECISNNWRPTLYYRMDLPTPLFTRLPNHCLCTGTKPGSQIISIVPNQPETGCPQTGCKFTVKDSNGAVIFSETREGGCPEWRLEYPCPEGTLECGDCCLSCSDTADSIREMRSMLHQLQSAPVISTRS